MGIAIASLVWPSLSLAEPDCEETGFSVPGEESWGPLFVRSSQGTLLPTVSIVALGDSELWLQGRLFLGTGEPIVWTQGPYSALTGTIALSLPEGIGEHLAALRVSALAKDPNTGALRSVRSAARVYVRQVGESVTVLSEEEALSFAVLPASVDEDVEDGLVGREVSP